MSKEEYILCAAIRFGDEENEFIVPHFRHHLCFELFRVFKMESGNSDIKPFPKRSQGFLTSKNRFVDRREGAEIAFRSGQIPNPKQILFSEDLY